MKSGRSRRPTISEGMTPPELKPAILESLSPRVQPTSAGSAEERRPPAFDFPAAGRPRGGKDRALSSEDRSPGRKGDSTRGPSPPTRDDPHIRTEYRPDHISLFQREESPDRK